MDIHWTRMAGQWPVEASPLVGKFSGSGQAEILVLNRGGQLLLWNADGTSVGPGQDGLVAQLPPGQWTTTPTLVDSASGPRFVIASVEGRVVGLDGKFEPLWEYQLKGNTSWGRAVPVLLRSQSGQMLVFNDQSGSVTCLKLDGSAAWSNPLAAGVGNAPAQAISLNPNEDAILVHAGSTLCCCGADGSIRWRRELDSAIATRPEVLSLPGEQRILCGTEAGTLFALSHDGKILWQCATGDTFSNWITLLPRHGTEPLILFTGLWGNLHAIDVQGRPVWTHLFRAKTRGVPLVLDANGDGRSEVFVPAFDHHVYVFGEDGELRDDVRLSGIMPSALVPMIDLTSGQTDLLVTTTALLGYRLRPGMPKSPYGPTPEPQNIGLQFPWAKGIGGYPALVVDNPEGALVNIHLMRTDPSGWKRMAGILTTQSRFEVPLPPVIGKGEGMVQATATDAAGKLLAEESWTMPSVQPTGTWTPPTSGGLRVWSTEPYGSIDEIRLAPVAGETKEGDKDRVSVNTLYLDEADQGAFIVDSTRNESTRARVVLSHPARQDGAAFGGSILLREVVPTGSVNGEKVPDALPTLGDAGLITIRAQRFPKIWISVDARGAEPGEYTGHVTVTPLDADSEKAEIPLVLEVLDIRLPREFPLTLCTWDYVPNRWFPTRSQEVLDDMSRHGVNVFPRSIIPPARLNANGPLSIDWTTLDAELNRLDRRGKILFHLNHPPIEFAAPTTEEEKRGHEIEYIRALRDHLRERGREYPDYAFYLLDEPGLDYGPNVAILLDAGKLFREADPKLLTYTDPVPGLSWKDFERIESLVDVWAPNMHLVSGLLSGDPRIERILRAKTVWSYECVSQVKSLSPLRYNRANAWRAKYFGLTGIGFWTHSTTDIDHWFPGKTINDEYALVYPGELPVPSVRWEAVRDGLEDVAAIVLLEDQIQRHRQAGTKSELVQEAEATLRIALRDIMELSDESFVQSRDFLRQGDRMLGHTRSDIDTFRRHREQIAQWTLALAAE
jgi:hypothetical protein